MGMGTLLGFDPGGCRAFGWCIVEDSDELPLPVVAAGVGQDARDAFDQVVAQLSPETNVRAAGIDSPLFWTASDRRADQILRRDIAACGAPSPGGTVQAVNSLRGACLVQGVLLGGLLRERWPALSISEAHPKAYLWLTGIANENRHPRSIGLAPLASLFAHPPDTEFDEHIRDSAIAALSAWAMVHRPPRWRNLFVEEAGPFMPIGQPLGYWMPELPGATKTQLLPAPGGPR
jgi:hypothetical protein